ASSHDQNQKLVGTDSFINQDIHSLDRTPLIKSLPSFQSEHHSNFERTKPNGRRRRPMTNKHLIRLMVGYPVNYNLPNHVYNAFVEGKEKLKRFIMYVDMQILKDRLYCQSNSINDK
ncbi:unnamed protein product, partial [Dovyalis caffra]